jgi:hypothetical protein
MKRFLTILAVLLIALPAMAGTDMLTAAGTTTAPVASTCPSTFRGTCATGWFSVRGAAYVIIQVSENSGTATVTLNHRVDSTGPTSTINTWTNPTSTQVPVAIWPPTGDLQINVSAVGGGGTVKAKIEAYQVDGTRLW